MKLIVLDVDGVLSHGEAQAFDLAVLERLRRLNQEAKSNESLPAVTLNTGRPSPYVEALMQAIDGWRPALFENGAGMYFPQSYQFKVTPLFSQSIKSQLDTLIALLDKEIVQKGKAYWQPGKTVCHTLFSYGEIGIGEIAVEASRLAGTVSDDLSVVLASQALNIYPKLINKGTGLQWLSEETGISALEMAGVGDSDGDIDFLRLVASPAAPENSTSGVKAIAHYVSAYQTAAGLADVLDYWKL
jgi:hydroxymethylpyrimidine pyrophosphatase-like HAD family hydrolase